MEKIRVFKDGGETIGTLSFDRDRDLFLFEYDDGFIGFDFGDFNIKHGRSFELSEMYGLFSTAESYSRNMMCEEFHIEDPDSNESQWRFLTIYAENKSGSRGIYYEKYKKDS